MSITAEEVIANLRAMLADPAQLPATKPKLAEDTVAVIEPTTADVAPPVSPAVAFVKEVVEFVPTLVNDPEAFTGMPVVDAFPTPKKWQSLVDAANSAVTQQIVVLDDGATYSNLEGCKFCEIPMDSSGTGWTLTEESYAAGVSISDLLTLRDALMTIRHILG